MNKLVKLLLAALIISLAACERRPLLDPGEMARVKVVLKTTAIPNVTTGIYNNNLTVPLIQPKIMRVMFFDVDTKRLVSQGFISTKGITESGDIYFVGDVSVLPGNYDILCYNFDTPNTLIKDEQSLNTITAFTSEISEYLYSRFNSRAKPEELMPRIYYEPEHLFVAKEENMHVVKQVEPQVIEVEASSVVDSYYIQLRIKNGKYASDASAIVTDLAPSNRIGVNERKFDEYSATFFEMQRSTDVKMRSGNNEVLCAVFNTFGKRPDNIDPVAESKLYVTFNVITVDGKNVELSLNLDSVFQTTDARERKWLLLDYEFEIPVPDNPPTGESSGFKPEVEGWNSEEGFIELD